MPKSIPGKRIAMSLDAITHLSRALPRLAIVAALIGWPLQASSADACPDCSSTTGSLEVLRRVLPDDWLLQIEQEPVFNGKVLTVQAGQEHAQTILLVHGLGYKGFKDWLKVIPHLAQHYHVIALDLPGFGYSSSPLGKYSPRNYARLLSWIVSKHGKGPAIVVGHSMGAAVALRFGGDRPDQISKLILVDAAGILHRNPFVNRINTVTDKSLPFILKQAVGLMASVGDIAIDEILSIPLPHEILARHDALWGFLLPLSTLNAALALVDEDLSEVIYTQKIPTHVIWGESDQVAPMRTGLVLGANLPRAQLHVLQKIGHVPMEAATTSFLSLLDKTLDSDPRPAATDLAAPLADLPDLVCTRETGRQYSGHYHNVLIDGCKGISLRNLKASHIAIRNARLDMTNVQVVSDGIAIDVDNSVVTMTASEAIGDIAIHASDSRLDLAGVKLTGRTDALRISLLSRLVGSANLITSPKFNGYWHGRKILEMATLSP